MKTPKLWTIFDSLQVASEKTLKRKSQAALKDERVDQPKAEGEALDGGRPNITSAGFR